MNVPSGLRENLNCDFEKCKKSHPSKTVRLERLDASPSRPGNGVIAYMPGSEHSAVGLVLLHYSLRVRAENPRRRVRHHFLCTVKNSGQACSPQPCVPRYTCATACAPQRLIPPLRHIYNSRCDHHDRKECVLVITSYIMLYARRQ